jgi:hypothetical protein
MKREMKQGIQKVLQTIKKIVLFAYPVFALAMLHLLGRIAQ